MHSLRTRPSSRLTQDSDSRSGCDRSCPLGIRTYTGVFAQAVHPTPAQSARCTCGHNRAHVTYMMSICGRKRTHNSSRTPRSAGYRKHPSRAYHTYHNATVCFLRDASNGCASLEPMPDSERPPLCCTCVRPYGQVPVWETRMLHSPWFGSGIGPTPGRNGRRNYGRPILSFIHT